MFIIRPITDSASTKRITKEYNLLWYGPSLVLGAYDDSGNLQGAIRYARRINTPLAHGLLTDLQLSESKEPQAKKCAYALIEAAQEELRKSNITKIDAVVIDGSKLAQHFIDNGFWASRKTVVVEWDLADIKKPPKLHDMSLECVTQFDTNEVSDFIIRSYQPYWRWWKNDAFDRLWDRVDYPDYKQEEIDIENAQHNREQIINILKQGLREASEGKHIFAIARKAGKIIGMCDAKIVEDELDDCSDWGVLMEREHPGKGFGQLLLMSCLQWLRADKSGKAIMTTTSGLDDYDPTVYLYVQSCGGTIKAEFNNFVRRKKMIG